jgi:transposase
MFDYEIKNRAIVHYNFFNKSIRGVALIYNVSKSTLSRWVRSLDRCKIRKKFDRGSKYDRIQPLMLEIVQHNPYVKCHDIQRRICSRYALTPSKSTIYRSLKRLGLTHKRAQNVRQPNKLSQHPFYDGPNPYHDAISIDECHFDAADFQRYGWCYKNERVAKRKPNQYQRVSLLLALSADGVVKSQLVKESVNSTTFIDFIRDLPRGRNVIVDNASIHTARAVKSYCVENDITLNYTPPYSPWYNPVEFSFSVIKSAFRTLRTTENNFFYEDILHAIDSVKSTAQFFSHSQRIWATDKAALELE